MTTVGTPQGPGSRPRPEGAARKRPVPTPAGPRGYVCLPAPAEWARAVADNRARLAEMAFDVAGGPAAELRRRARARVLALAGLDAEAGGDRRALLLTGHQPQFYHPGIWAKAFTVAAEAKRQDAFGLNIAVDHDAGELAAEIPWRDGPGGRLGFVKE